MQPLRILALGLAAVAACYSTPQPDCGFRCGPNGECPADYQCASDNVCHRVGSPASLICRVDAPPPPPPSDAATDAPIDAPTDAPIDAPTDAPVDAPPDAPVDAMPDAP